MRVNDYTEIILIRLCCYNAALWGLLLLSHKVFCRKIIGLKSLPPSLTYPSLIPSCFFFSKIIIDLSALDQEGHSPLSPYEPSRRCQDWQWHPRGWPTVAHPLPVQACITVSEGKWEWSFHLGSSKASLILLLLFWIFAEQVGRGWKFCHPLGLCKCREHLRGRWWPWLLCMVYSSLIYIHHAQFNVQQYSISILLE